MHTKTFHNSERGGAGPRSRHGGKAHKAKKGGHKGRGSKRLKTAPLLEQPIAESVGTVPCQLCGHPVDPRRMHPHMVRFHGAAFRTKPA
jgi:hypothetical protein